MKKYYFLILILFLFPVFAFAKDSDQKDFLSMLAKIKNVQVDEEKRILDTKVDSNFISFRMEEDGRIEEYSVSYSFQERVFSFSSGKGKIKNSNLNRLVGNETAFYLYSILESQSTSSYQQEYYYNQEEIINKWNDLSEEKKKNFCSEKIPIEIWDLGKTFGILLSPKQEKNDCYLEVSYQYSLDGKDAIIVPKSKDQAIFHKFVDGSYIKLVSIFLFLGILLSAYSYYDMKKKRKRNT